MDISLLSFACTSFDLQKKYDVYRMNFCALFIVPCQMCEYIYQVRLVVNRGSLFRLWTSGE